MISAVFWIAIGIAGSLTAVAVGSRRIRPAAWITGPLLGAVLAAVLTPVVASLVFPIDYKGRIPPRERDECFLVGAVGGAILALGAGYSLKPGANAAAR